MPFSWKLMPAAFPAFTTTSPAARTEVCAGAIRVSSATGLPSATIETQLVSSARISRVKVGVGLAAAEAVLWEARGLPGDRFTVGFEPDSACGADGGVAFKEGAGAGDRGEIFDTLAVSDAVVGAGVGFPAFCGTVEWDAWIAVETGVVTGAGAADATEAATGSRCRREFQMASANVTSSNPTASLPHGIWRVGSFS